MESRALSRQLHRIFPIVTCLSFLTACSDGAEPVEPAHLDFSIPSLDLGVLPSGQVEILNSGGETVGPVEILPGAVLDAAGSTVPGTTLRTDPTVIPVLEPGDARLLWIELVRGGTLAPGNYDAVVTARGGEAASAQLVVRFEVLSAAEESTRTVRILSEAASARAGDVVPLPVEARDSTGALLQGVPVSWSLEPATAGLVGATGQFVGYEIGAVRVVARVGSAADTVELTVAPRGVEGDFTVVGRGREVSRFTSDLWLHGNVAYTGSWGSRQTEAGANVGNTLNVWDITNPAAITKVFSLEIDARTVNDVKVRADGTLGLITHEGASDGLEGITLLDLSDPLRPTPIGRVTTELESGVHNAWIEGDYVYAVADGTGNGLKIFDISDPAKPKLVSRFYAGSSFLHDVYVRDGLAFLSHWDAGLVILDVGNGIAGGTPENPVEVSRLTDLGGQTHNAWYWPEEGYVFVGEEDFNTPGIMHVVDVRNLSAPREVATYAVPGQPPHNFWLDEDRGVLYLAWYGNGIRALDVTGDLLGELDREGREIAGLRYNGGPGSCNSGSGDTCAWAPRLHNGLVWVSDLNSGLVALAMSR
jgi:hypothetical protein